MSELRRPTSIAEVVERLDMFRSDAARRSIENFTARASDVFVATYTKSGTTWSQQIVHQVRSGGSMDFVEIGEVVPWFESAVDMGIDPTADQRWSPRAFKSHLMWSDLPRNARYIVVFRDPVTVLPSFYRFFEGWWFEPGSVTIDDFASHLYLMGSASGRHWDHFVDWWPHIGNSNVLALTYEDMVADPDAVPPLVAAFLGLEVDAATMDTVVEHCSRAFMLDHASQFEEILLRRHRDHVWGLPEGGQATKVTAGGAVAISDGTLEALEHAWQETVTKDLGFGSYIEYRRALPNPLNVPRP